MAAGDNDPLPEVLAEAKAVARFGHNPTLLVSDQATEAHVLARLTDASVLHFAGHAVSQDGATRLLLAPALSSYRNGVEVADSPYLDSALLRKFPPRAAQLAVLSACSTGKKEEEWNHSMSDLVETLAALKVPEVVATRWQIDSAAAVPLMDAFYGGLANGRTVPQALTEARRSLVRDGRYRHPYYWAGSYASGSSRSDLRGIFHSQGE